jgi:hypothetical protein
MKNPTSGLQQRFTMALLNGRPFPHQSSGMFRPSEGSVTIRTQHGPMNIGACKRKTWFRLKRIEVPRIEPLPHQIQRMRVGKEVENSIIETCKREGLYIANNIPFRVVMDGIPIAGELDAVLRTEPCGGDKFICEVKSCYGYPAQKTAFGSFAGKGKELGKPKDSYIMQIALYLNHFSRLPKEDLSYLPFGAILIIDRGDGHFGVFDIWLEEELRVMGEDEVVSSHKIYYSSEPMRVPKTLVPYTTEDILSGYRVVQNALKGDEPLPRDFTREYDREQVEINYERGLISKSYYEKWQSSNVSPRGKKKFKLGDWQCSYCDWADYCWSLKE